MKKKKPFSAVSVAVLCVIIFVSLGANVYAYENIRQCTCAIDTTNSAVKATIISHPGTTVYATLELYRVSGGTDYLLSTWTANNEVSGSSYLQINKPYSFSSGMTYKLILSGTAVNSGYSEPFSKTVIETA